MSKNIIYQQLAEEKFNKNNNYQAIISRIKEGEAMKKKNISKKQKILSLAAVVLIVILIGGMIPTIYAKIKWNIEFKEYQNRNIEYGLASIKEAVTGGYTQNIDMDYIYKGDIGVKLDKLLITDDYFETNIDFKFNKNININTDTFMCSYAIYDENNNIYGIYERIKINNSKGSNYWKKLYEELGVKYDKKNVFDIQLEDTIANKVIASSKENGNIVLQNELTSHKGFPKSKKLYVRIFDIGYSMLDFETHTTEDFTISDAEWQIEIDVPEEFYKRETIELALKNNIEDLEIEKFEVTETGLTLNIGKEEWIQEMLTEMREKDYNSEIINNIVFITDENENKYYGNYNMGTTETGGLKLKFDINKEKISNQNLYLNFNINEKTNKELIIKK